MKHNIFMKTFTHICTLREWASLFFLLSFVKVYFWWESQF